MSRLRHDLPNDLNGYFKETPSQTAGPSVTLPSLALWRSTALPRLSTQSGHTYLV